MLGLRRLKNAVVNRAHLGLGNQYPRSRWIAPRSQRHDFERLAERYGHWTSRCVSLNAQACAGIDWQLMTADDSAVTKDTFRKAPRRMCRHLQGQSPVAPGRTVKAHLRARGTDVRVVPRHPVIDLLENVNAWSDGFAFREAMFSDLQIFGRAFIHKLRDGSGTVTELWRAMPQRVRVIPHPDNFVDHFEIGQGATRTDVAPEDMIWLKLYDPFSPWGGMGWIEQWLTAIDASEHIFQFQDWLFEHHGTPDIVLKSEGGWGADEKKSFRSEWRRQYGKHHARQSNLAFLDGDVEIERLNQSNKELEFTASNDQKRDEISAAAGIPKSFNTLDDVNRATMEASMELYVRQTVWPYVQRVEDTLNEQLVPDWTNDAFIAHENPIPEDAEDRRQERASRLASGYTINQSMELDGEEPIDSEFADEPLVAAGVVPLSSLMTTGGASADPSVGDQSPDEGPDLSGLETTQETVLNGIQIQAATDIVQRVADDQLPVDAARGLLRVLFNLDDAQVDAILGSADSFEPEPPEMPMLPGADGPPTPQDEPAEPADGDDAPEKRAVVSQKAVWSYWGGVPELSKALEVGDPEKDDADGHRENDPFSKAIKARLRIWVRTIAKRLEDERKAPGQSEAISAEDIGRWHDQMRATCRPHIREAVAKSGTVALTELPGDTAGVFDLLNNRTRDFIEDSASRIGRTSTDEFVKRARTVLAGGVEDGLGPAEIAKRLRAHFPEEDLGKRADVIARTETAFAQIRGTELGWEQSGVVRGKQFVLAPNPCPWCEAVAERLGDGRGELGKSTTVPLADPLLPFGTELEIKGKDGEPKFMRLDYAPDGERLVLPPVHPNCRCSMRPVLEGE